MHPHLVERPVASRAWWLAIALLGAMSVEDAPEPPLAPARAGGELVLRTLPLASTWWWIRIVDDSGARVLGDGGELVACQLGRWLAPYAACR